MEYEALQAVSIAMLKESNACTESLGDVNILCWGIGGIGGIGDIRGIEGILCATTSVSIWLVLGLGV